MWLVNGGVGSGTVPGATLWMDGAIDGITRAAGRVYAAGRKVPVGAMESSQYVSPRGLFEYLNGRRVAIYRYLKWIFLWIIGAIYFPGIVLCPWRKRREGERCAPCGGMTK